MEEKWINNLREKMESHEQPEPSGLWDDIEAALNEKKLIPLFNRRKAFLWSASIGAVAAMLMLIFLLGNRDSSLLTIPTDIEPTTAKQDVREPNRDEDTNKIIEKTEERKSLLATNIPPYNKKQSSIDNEEQIVVSLSEEEDLLEKLESESIEEREEVDTKEWSNRQTEPTKESQSEKRHYFPNGRTEYETDDNYVYRRTSKEKGKLIASVYSTNLPNTSGESSGYGELIARTTLPGQMSANRVEEQGAAADVIFSNMGEETYTHTEHKQPIKAGLSIRYQLTDKFGIESGLTYTYLSSNLTSGTLKNLFETEQSLHYVGIPLNVNYNMWRNKQWSLYVSAGGLLEKCVDGKYHTDYIINNKIVETDDDTIKDKPLQFSVNSAVGLQYNMTPKLSVFAEPGVGYYFDNGSDIETIYKEKPFNLNLKFGIRVNIN